MFGFTLYYVKREIDDQLRYVNDVSRERERQVTRRPYVAQSPWSLRSIP